MFNSQWLDIAIGVVFVWFLLALTVTAINEALTRILAMRSRQLWQWLHQILDGQQNVTSIWRNAFTLWRKSKDTRPTTTTLAANASFSHKLYATKTVHALETRTANGKKT